MNSVHDYFVARQPVFTQHGNLWGYEILFREGSCLKHPAATPEAATAGVIVDGIALTLPRNKKHVKALINIPEYMLENDMLGHLPQDSCILEILEDVVPSPKVMHTLERLKARGYTLALDDYTGQESLEPFLSVVDIVKVDFLGMNRQVRRGLTQRLRSEDRLILLAEKVETTEDALQAKELGYGLVQGYYFQKPEIFNGSKVPSTLSARLHALWLLSNPEIERKDLLEFFVRSPQLTFRLLQFVNSAAFTTASPIQTLENTISFLGIEKVRTWIMAALLADGQRSDVKQELATLATSRACFMQNIASKLSLPNPEYFFMTGLFSLLDALYAIPFKKLLADIPLPEDVSQTLVHREGRIFPWLQVAASLEQGNFAGAESVLKSLNIPDIQHVVSAHNDAVRWARDTIL